MTKPHRTILIVDDNKDVSLILTLTLRAKGFTVLEAEDGSIQGRATDLKGRVRPGQPNQGGARP